MQTASQHNDIVKGLLLKKGIIKEIEKLHLRIAVILDEFSYQCFKHESILMPIGINDWKDTLNAQPPDLLLVESAWKGNSGTWQYKIARYHNSNPSKELAELVNYCRSNGIPTIFWNKEDPIFFKRFIESAKLFDYIFTTDINMISKYKNILGHDRIYALPFAAQPKIHNPMDKDKERLGKVAFAGTYHRQKFPERKKGMEAVLEPALSYHLDIYNRLQGRSKSPLFQYPSIFQRHVRGYLPYRKMVETYKKYDIFLNVNIVNDSPTMFSRRVFELLACGVNIISAYSQGIEELFGRIVMLARTQQETRKFLDLLLNNKDLRDRLSLLGQREVFKKHTYRHRLDTMLERVGLLNRKTIENPGVTILSYLENLESLNDIVENFLRQNYERKELIFLIKNKSISLDHLKERFRHHNNVKVLIFNHDTSMGQCLNYGVSQSAFDYITRFAPGHFYGNEFIGDLMNSFNYIDGGIAGKCAYYHYLAPKNTLVLRFPHMEYQNVDFLWESAFIVQKRIIERIKFRDTSDRTVFLFFKDCIASGITLYAADRFNYVCTDQLSDDFSTAESPCDELVKFEIIGHLDDYRPYITV